MAGDNKAAEYVRAVFLSSSPRLYPGIIALFVNLSLTISGNSISKYNLPSKSITIVAGALVAYTIIYLLICEYRGRRRRKELQRRLVNLVLDRKAPQPARGLILLISPLGYPRQKEPPFLAQQDISNKINQVILEDDAAKCKRVLEELELQNSNLATRLKAIEYHMSSGTLRDVWLISTKDIPALKKSGSHKTARLLYKYIKICHPGIHPHLQEPVDPIDCVSLGREINDIFRSPGWQRESILVDITGGTAMMSAAAAMACVALDRKMQYMDADRRWDGELLGAGGSMMPVLMDITPEFVENSSLVNQVVDGQPA